MAERRYVGHVGTCESHGKRLYPDRASAKRVIRELGDKGMRAYRCETVDGWWHIGHLSPLVRSGRTTAAELYGEGS